MGHHTFNSIARDSLVVQQSLVVSQLLFFLNCLYLIDDGNLAKKWSTKEHLYPIRKLDQSKVSIDSVLFICLLLLLLLLL